MLIDTHCHVHVSEFDADRSEVIKRAQEAEVECLFVGFEPDGNEKAALLAHQYNGYFTVGIHPHNADLTTDKNLERMRQFAKGEDGKRLKAIGELGLDYFKNHQPREVQLKAFSSQLQLARELQLPVIIHCRDAFEDVLKILAQEKIVDAVFHCFAGTLEEAQECWKRGYYTSFTGICTYPKAQNIRSAIAAAPTPKIMIESDCPFLAPEGHRGERNEPSFLRETFRKIAQVKKIPEPEMEEILFQNTRRFFRLP